MLPNFVIIGAPKCGTTSLYHYLRQHPSVFMCVPKEPEFFSGSGRISTVAEYEALFDGVDGQWAVGEASVGYLHDVRACTRMKEAIPEARLIAVLRDPADRAYSHYNMLVAHGAVPNRSYLKALRRARREGDYRNTGIPTSRYAASLQRFFEAFGREQLHVYLFSDYKRDATSTLRSIFDYIGVDPLFEPDTARRHNRGRRPRSSRIHRLIHGAGVLKGVAKTILPKALRRKAGQLLRRFNRSSVPPLSTDARRIIVNELREDIEQTEDLLGRDLSAWKNPNAKDNNRTMAEQP